MGRPWSPGPTGADASVNGVNFTPITHRERANTLASTMPRDEISDDEDDGGMSNAGTETTEAGSEITSQGSLTSID